MNYKDEVLKLCEEVGIEVDDSKIGDLVKQFARNCIRGEMVRNEKYRQKYVDLAYNVAVFYTRKYLMEIKEGSKEG